MSTFFMHKNAETGALEEVEYWDSAESAGLLRVSVKYLRKMCRTKQWPHLNSSGHYFLNADHIEWINDWRTVEPDTPGPPKVTRLGVVLNQEELAELEQVQ